METAQSSRIFRKPKPAAQVVKTWAFDSVGSRKYAVQIKRASNGNPCLKLVEGVPQEDGTYRKFNLTVWSGTLRSSLQLSMKCAPSWRSTTSKPPPGISMIPMLRADSPNRERAAIVVLQHGMADWSQVGSNLRAAGHEP
jgi:hypothetical protein